MVEAVVNFYGATNTAEVASVTVTGTGDGGNLLG